MVYKSIRNSNIELLRLICMFIIILHHAVFYGGGIGTGLPFNSFLSACFYIGGKFGANCFMAISAYYLIGSSFKIQRIVSVWKTTFFYGILFFILNFAFHFKTLQIIDVLETALPITYKSYWYITAFVGILFLSPFLNMTIEKLTKNTYGMLVIILFFMVAVPITIFPKAMPFADESHLLLFVFIYLLIGYYKKGYIIDVHKMVKLLMVLGLAWMILSALIVIVLSCLMSKTSIASYSTFWMKGESIPMIMASIGLTLYVFEKEPNEIRIINSISKGSLDIYLIHMNHFVYLWLWKQIIPVSSLVNDYAYSIIILAVAFVIFTITLTIGNIRALLFSCIFKRFKIPRVEGIYMKINKIMNF